MDTNYLFFLITCYIVLEIIDTWVVQPRKEKSRKDLERVRARANLLARDRMVKYALTEMYGLTDEQWKKVIEVVGEEPVHKIE